MTSEGYQQGEWSRAGGSRPGGGGGGEGSGVKTVQAGRVSHTGPTLGDLTRLAVGEERE